MELLGVKRRWLFELIHRGEITTRVGAKSARGKPKREILLESLPTEAQAKYFAPSLSAGRNVEVSNGLTPFSPADDAVDPDRQTPGLDVKPSTDLAVRAPSVASPLVGASEEELAEVNELAAMLDAIERAKNKSAAIEELARLKNVSRQAIYNWRSAYRREGVNGLFRKKRSDAGSSRVADSKIIARIKSEFLQTYRPPITQVHAGVVKDYEMNALKPPSYAFVRRVTKEIDPDLVARFRIGEREYDDKFCYITRRRKPELPRQWVDADHHQWDHYVIFDNGEIGRPWMTAIQDICTNEILGYRLTRETRATYPGSTAIALTLRHAILRKHDSAWPSYGLFENFYADLGKDFRGQHVRSICHDLHIKIVHARGYHGKSKPIERWFGVAENPLKKLPGYCGSNPKTNPERQRIGAPRDFEDMRKELMTIGEFDTAVRNWIVNDFHHAESRALKGLSPIGVLEQHVKNGWRAKELTRESVLDLLLMRRAKKKVMRFGISMFGTANHQRVFFAPELLDLINQEVEVFWDSGSIGELVIYKDSRFVCKATNKELLAFGASEEDVKAEREIRRQQKESMRDRIERLQVEAQYPNEMERVQAAKSYDKIAHEEREKLVANAQAGSVPVLLSQFAGAAKKLAVVKGSRPQNASAEKRDSKSDPFDDPPTIEQMFPRREREAWEQDDEPLKSSEELFREDDSDSSAPRFGEICDSCRSKTVDSGDITLCFPCSKNLCTACFNADAHKCETG